VLTKTNAAGVMTRPVWTPLHKLPMFKDSLRDDLLKTEKFAKLLINLPSSPVGDLT
jgi:dTDP-4-amino-4,6-dideoxygalactose transaminase